MAQVMPVVALAVVFEIRIISSSWNENTPRGQRRLQSLIWACILLVLAFGEGAALRSLRGVEVAAWWPRVCEYAISGGLGILVLSPVLEVFLRGNAETAARLVSLRPLGRLQLWWTDRKILRYIKRTERLMNESQFLIYEGLATARRMEANLGQDEKWLADAEARLSSVDASRVEPDLRLRVGRVRALLAQQNDILSTFRAKRTDRILQHRLDREKHVRAKADYMSKRLKYREDRRSLTAADREQLTAFFRTFSLTAQPGASEKRGIELEDRVADALDEGPPERRALDLE
jgi:hypothetical protein